MSVNIQNVIDTIMPPTLGQENTVDKLEFGDPETIVQGIAVTFLATQEVIEKSIKLGLNLIITHEGIFYNHLNKIKAIESDPVYQCKRETIKSGKIALFRFHDTAHRYKTDVIMTGLLRRLGWDSYEVKKQQTYSVLIIPEMTLREVMMHIKKSLSIEYVRFIGDLTMKCRRIGILVGYRGTGEMTIPLFHQENLDLMVYGEGPEWETPEYVRDTIQQGRQKSLLVLGHAESEMPGMEYVASILREKFPDIPVHHISQSPLFLVF
ncbi:MAG TPA: Nif3-like dinuclear metal center hexameric protein [Candidatus Atribacteria bacterium]|nr:Nif3-like dinuclear metal center hexameric protein [Candidatus Atribacteria bacterium]